MISFILIQYIAQSAGAVEYIDLISAEGYDARNENPGYDTKQSDGEASAMLELLGMRITPSLSSLPGPIWPRVVASDRVLNCSYAKLVLNCSYAKLNCKKLTLFPFN